MARQREADTAWRSSSPVGLVRAGRSRGGGAMELGELLIVSAVLETAEERAREEHGAGAPRAQTRGRRTQLLVGSRGDGGWLGGKDEEETRWAGGWIGRDPEEGSGGGR